MEENAPMAFAAEKIGQSEGNRRVKPMEWLQRAFDVFSFLCLPIWYSVISFRLLQKKLRVPFVFLGWFGLDLKELIQDPEIDSKWTHSKDNNYRHNFQPAIVIFGTSTASQQGDAMNTALQRAEKHIRQEGNATDFGDPNLYQL